jgi:hypothetical protein
MDRSCRSSPGYSLSSSGSLFPVEHRSRSAVPVTRTQQPNQSEPGCYTLTFMKPNAPHITRISRWPKSGFRN